MYPTVKNVVPQDDYMLALEFDNGELRKLDMKPYLDFGVFKRLKNIENFAKVRVSFDTIEWPAAPPLNKPPNSCLAIPLK